MFSLILIIVPPIFSQTVDRKLGEIGEEHRATEERIKALVERIENKLLGTTVLELFRQEQIAWLAYRDMHLKTIYPVYINGVRIQWGSIQSYYLAKIIIRFNTERIGVLLDYLDENNEYGTSGSRLQLMDIVNEFAELEGR